MPKRRAVEAAYFPWASGLNALLDSLVDLDEDPDDASHLRRYESREHAAERLAAIAVGARERVSATARRSAARGDPHGDGGDVPVTARGLETRSGGRVQRRLRGFRAADAPGARRPRGAPRRTWSRRALEGASPYARCAEPQSDTGHRLAAARVRRSCRRRTREMGPAGRRGFRKARGRPGGSSSLWRFPDQGGSGWLPCGGRAQGRRVQPADSPQGKRMAASSVQQVDNQSFQPMAR